jgi:hypothetical protein
MSSNHIICMNGQYSHEVPNHCPCFLQWYQQATEYLPLTLQMMNYIAEAINHYLLKNWKHIVVLLDGHPMRLAEIKLQHLRRHRIGRDRTRTRRRRTARNSFWWGAYDDVAEERRRRRASLRLSWMRRRAWSRTTLWAATPGALTGQTFIVTRGERAVPWSRETAGEMEERAAGGGWLDEDERLQAGCGGQRVR